MTLELVYLNMQSYEMVTVHSYPWISKYDTFLKVAFNHNTASKVIQIILLVVDFFYYYKLNKMLSIVQIMASTDKQQNRMF